MTPHIAAAAASRQRIADLIHAAGQKLSNRVHAAADARALGQTVTEAPGPLGLSGRHYDVSQFDARLQNARARRPGRDGRHE
jgi:hypothetical protein